MPSHRLFQLNSPPGWNTSKDHLSGRLLASDEPPFGLSWEDLTEEMIFVTSSRCSLGIDLGWYPDYSPEGQFRIEVVDLDNLAATYAKPLREFATRSVWTAKQKLEEWMAVLHASILTVKHEAFTRWVKASCLTVRIEVGRGAGGKDLNEETLFAKRTQIPNAQTA